MAAAVALVASEALGSRPQATEADAPVPPCPSTPNCARLRVPVASAPLAVTEAVHRAFSGLGDTGLGTPAAFVPTATGALATFAVGPFQDEVAVEVEPASRGSVLWVRSAAESGRSDLGVNRRRAQRVVEAVAAWLPPEAREEPAGQ
ncbi:DUF1499 domain-containing protein [Rubrivirga sp.]|uniref:DUF1499 domain-containing protein n=1 Tax=Rubrivirga sp. TaxID=1885344 RepID=UPI003B520C1A